MPGTSLLGKYLGVCYNSIGDLAHCSSIAISYCNNFTIDRTFCQTQNIFDIYHLVTPIQVLFTFLIILIPYNRRCPQFVKTKTTAFQRLSTFTFLVHFQDMASATRQTRGQNHQPPAPLSSITSPHLFEARDFNVLEDNSASMPAPNPIVTMSVANL